MEHLPLKCLLFLIKGTPFDLKALPFNQSLLDFTPDYRAFGSNFQDITTKGSNEESFLRYIGSKGANTRLYLPHFPLKGKAFKSKGVPFNPLF